MAPMAVMSLGQKTAVKVPAFVQKLLGALVSAGGSHGGVDDVIPQDRQGFGVHGLAVALEADFVGGLADVGDPGMAQALQLRHSLHSRLLSVADHLVVFCLQLVEAAVYHIIKVFFQKAEHLLVAAPQDRGPVHLIVADQPEGGGIVDLDGK